MTTLEELRERLEAKPEPRTRMLEDIFRERIDRLEQVVIALLSALIEKEKSNG